MRTTGILPENGCEGPGPISSHGPRPETTQVSEREPAEWETAHDCADEGPALDSPPDVPSYELEVVFRALHQQVRDDLWFAEELAARVLTPERRGQLQAAVEAQWPVGERDPDSPDYDSLTPFFAVDDAIDDEGWERIVELTGEVLQPLQCWDPRLIEHLGDAAVEHLCHLIGIPYVWTWSWRSELVHEIPEQRARTTGGRSASAPTPARRFEDTTDHHFEFRFPAYLTLPAAERLISDFTATVARELWDATGFKEKLPNADALRRATRCYYLRRLHGYSVRRTAIEVFGNATRRTEVKQAERRVAAILGADGDTPADGEDDRD